MVGGRRPAGLEPRQHPRQLAGPDRAAALGRAARADGLEAFREFQAVGVDLDQPLILDAAVQTAPPQGAEFGEARKRRRPGREAERRVRLPPFLQRPVRQGGEGEPSAGAQVG